MTALTLAACDDAETKRQRQQAEQAARSQAEVAAASKAAEEQLRSTARNITPGAKLRVSDSADKAKIGGAHCGRFAAPHQDISLG
ncbi:hypothetical protein NF552_25620 (plasmid) [Roseomonas mucosa]|nr:hypothetical protein NF552_25620 [Roseomonas mucosa]